MTEADIQKTKIFASTPDSTVDLPELDIYDTLVLFADIIDTGKVRFEMVNSDIFREAAAEILRLRARTNTREVRIHTESGAVHVVGEE